MNEFNMPPGLTRRERRQLIREHQKQDSRDNAGKANIFKWIKFIFFSILIIFIAAWWLKRPAAPQDPLNKIISRSGLHWHADLQILIKGEKQDIPSGIGIGAVHLPIHTHDDKDVIHMEFQGAVRARDLQLGQFFKNWKKSFSSQCIFDQCNGADGSLKMLVNGKENMDFESYQMKDEDKIEIIYD